MPGERIEFGPGEAPKEIRDALAAGQLRIVLGPPPGLQDRPAHCPECHGGRRYPVAPAPSSGATDAIVIGCSIFLLSFLVGRILGALFSREED